ncbi:MAG: hypothetical protein IJ333_07955, partial [Clostridia bacterium]|nr:hypothetical protein [Clostridia bacterium]
MMKYEESQKITALGVVIFSFFAMLLALAIAAAFGGLSALLVLKTNLPESFLKVGSVLGSGLGLVVATAFLTAAGKVKGIIAAAIMAVAMILIKVLGNALMDMGGFFTPNGLVGIV